MSEGEQFPETGFFSIAIDQFGNLIAGTVTPARDGQEAKDHAVAMTTCSSTGLACRILFNGSGQKWSTNKGVYNVNG